MEWSKLTLLFFNFLSQSLVWFHHPSSDLCNYTGKGYSICLRKALPEILHCVWKVPYRVQFLCVGQACLHLYRGHFEEMKYLLTQVADVLQSGPFRFSHQRSDFRSVNALGAGLTWDKSLPLAAGLRRGTFFQECPASWSFAYTNIQRVLNRLVCRCEEKFVTGNEIAGLGSSWNLFS
jgi:hypothetical protein